MRVIGPGGEQLGIMPTEKALSLASQYDLDLVEVAEQTQPPVCKILDFSKFKYEQEKKERQARKHQHQTKLKEIRIMPNIKEHDYQVKLKQMFSFLSKKDKVKLTLLFRGRQMEHIDLGKKVVERFISDIQGIGEVEKSPVLEGRMMSAIISPK
ncbi:MAG: translation initiation factor IF-3 [Candidatus Omnitrophica bacterium]|nr:translation initiation factor IF-3 [Candidatus Omnitrophota bacterium]MCM8771000.1 translation initiation factor IF-3 [Candidatus Omnitrophota bacterium]